VAKKVGNDPTVWGACDFLRKHVALLLKKIHYNLRNLSSSLQHVRCLLVANQSK
jgi:hypothetical protein